MQKALLIHAPQQSKPTAKAVYKYSANNLKGKLIGRINANSEDLDSLNNLPIHTKAMLLPQHFPPARRVNQQDITIIRQNHVDLIYNGGFTLTEVLLAVVIVGILSTIALPNYLNQLNRTRQSEAAASITQLQNAIAAFADENGVYPTSWKDLNEVAAIMTPFGETTQTDFKKMTLASSGCEQKNQTNCYTVEAINANQDSLYTLSALPVDTSRKNYNVIACLDLISGSSDFKKGKHSGAAEISKLNCRS